MSAVKTLSMVNYAFELREAFPDCKIYSNINLFGIAFVNLNNPKKHRFKTSKELHAFRPCGATRGERRAHIT